MRAVASGPEGSTAGALGGAEALTSVRETAGTSAPEVLVPGLTSVRPPLSAAEGRETAAAVAGLSAASATTPQPPTRAVDGGVLNAQPAGPAPSARGPRAPPSLPSLDNPTQATTLAAAVRAVHAALQGDRAAVAFLLTLLAPSDLARLRLLLRKVEERLPQTAAAAGGAAAAAAPLLSAMGGRVAPAVPASRRGAAAAPPLSAAAATAAAAASRRAAAARAPLQAVGEAVESGFKVEAAREKLSKQAARAASAAAAAGSAMADAAVTAAARLAASDSSARPEPQRTAVGDALQQRSSAQAAVTSAASGAEAVCVAGSSSESAPPPLPADGFLTAGPPSDVPVASNIGEASPEPSLPDGDTAIAAGRLPARDHAAVLRGGTAAIVAPQAAPASIYPPALPPPLLPPSLSSFPVGHSPPLQPDLWTVDAAAAAAAYAFMSAAAAAASAAVSHPGSAAPVQSFWDPAGHFVPGSYDWPPASMGWPPHPPSEGLPSAATGLVALPPPLPPSVPLVAPSGSADRPVSAARSRSVPGQRGRAALAVAHTPSTGATESAAAAPVAAAAAPAAPAAAEHDGGATAATQQRGRSAEPAARRRGVAGARSPAKPRLQRPPPPAVDDWSALQSYLPPLQVSRRNQLIRRWLAAATKAACRALGIKGAPSAAPSSARQPEVAGVTGSRAAAGVNLRSAGSGKRRLTKLKRAALRSRVNRWLAAHPEAASTYHDAAAERAAAESALAAAAHRARGVLRQATGLFLQYREDRRLQRLVDRGKLLPNGLSPSTQTAAALAAAAGGSGVGGAGAGEKGKKGSKRGAAGAAAGAAEAPMLLSATVANSVMTKGLAAKTAAALAAIMGVSDTPGVVMPETKPAPAAAGRPSGAAAAGKPAPAGAAASAATAVEGSGAAPVAAAPGKPAGPSTASATDLTARVVATKVARVPAGAAAGSGALSSKASVAYAGAAASLPQLGRSGAGPTTANPLAGGPFGLSSRVDVGPNGLSSLSALADLARRRPIHIPSRLFPARKPLLVTRKQFRKALMQVVRKLRPQVDRQEAQEAARAAKAKTRAEKRAAAAAATAATATSAGGAGTGAGDPLASAPEPVAGSAAVASGFLNASAETSACAAGSAGHPDEGESPAGPIPAVGLVATAPALASRAVSAKPPGDAVPPSKAPAAGIAAAGKSRGTVRLPADSSPASMFTLPPLLVRYAPPAPGAVLAPGDVVSALRVLREVQREQVRLARGIARIRQDGTLLAARPAPSDESAGGAGISTTLGVAPSTALQRRAEGASAEHAEPAAAVAERAARLVALRVTGSTDAHLIKSLVPLHEITEGPAPGATRGALGCAGKTRKGAHMPVAGTSTTSTEGLAGETAEGVGAPGPSSASFAGGEAAAATPATKPGQLPPQPSAPLCDQDAHPALNEMCAEMISTAAFYQERARAALMPPAEAAAPPHTATGSGGAGGATGAPTDSRQRAVKPSHASAGAGAGATAAGGGVPGSVSLPANKRRLVVGLREVLRGCKSGRVKLVIVAPNVRCDDGEEEAGVAVTVQAIITAARSSDPPIPLLFALNRKRMAAALGHKVRASVVGFYSLESLRGLHTRAVQLAEVLRRNFAHRAAGEPLEPLPLPAPVDTPIPLPDGTGSGAAGAGGGGALARGGGAGGRVGAAGGAAAGARGARGSAAPSAGAGNAHGPAGGSITVGRLPKGSLATAVVVPVVAHGGGSVGGEATSYRRVSLGESGATASLRAEAAEWVPPGAGQAPAGPAVTARAAATPPETSAIKPKQLLQPAPAHTPVGRAATTARLATRALEHGRAAAAATVWQGRSGAVAAASSAGRMQPHGSTAPPTGAADFPVLVGASSVTHGSSSVAAAAPPPARWPARSTYPVATSGRVDMGAAPPFNLPPDVELHPSGASADPSYWSGGAAPVGAGVASTKAGGKGASGGEASAPPQGAAATPPSSGLYAGWLRER